MTTPSAPQPGSIPSSGDKPRLGLFRLIFMIVAIQLIICLCVYLGIRFAEYRRGSSSALIGRHGISEETPAWSPDGRRIAFHADREGSRDIYVMDADGSNVVQLTSDPFSRAYFLRSPTDATPAWSPTDDRLAFSSGRDNRMMSYVDLDIYTMAADGSGLTVLTPGDAVDLSPCWSPDGTKLAFSRLDLFADSTFPREDSTWDIYAIDIDGAHEFRLTTDPANDSQCTWSPDGQHIAFVSDRGQSESIYVMDTDGQNVHLLIDIPATNPSWSPDGRMIAFVSHQTGKSRLAVSDIDGSAIHWLSAEDANAVFPAWSPGGGKIAFASDADGDLDIYVVNADGSNLLQLTGTAD